MATTLERLAGPARARPVHSPDHSSPTSRWAGDAARLAARGWTAAFAAVVTLAAVL